MPFVPLTADAGEVSHTAQPFDANYNTKLSPADEMKFRGWKAQYAPKDSGEDYDLRGAFKAGLQPDSKTGHWPDTFKKPNHPTFSDQSQYAPFGKPGSWDGDKFVPPSVAKSGFTPLNTPLEYSSNPIAKRAKYVAGVVPGIVETGVGGAIDFAGNLGAGIGGMIYGAAPAVWKGQKINWSDPNNQFYQEYAKENKLWKDNISPVLEPQTEAGKDIMGGFTNVAEKMKSLGEKVTDITGSESAGAWTEATLQAVGIPLGFKAAGMLSGPAVLAGSSIAAHLAKTKGAADGVATKASIADQLEAIRPTEAPKQPVAAPAAQGFTPLETTRYDLAQRSGEETIPAQIHREADGFDADQAAVLDAELNIRDEQGGVNDYSNYFRKTGLDEETAKSRGLLARAKGRAGYTIANQASDDLFAAHSAGIISDEAALAISRAAPGDSAVQAVGLKMVNEGKTIAQAENTIRAVAMMQKNGEAKPDQGDIFGFDDSAIRQAEDMAKRATAAQRAIREQLAAVSGATKRPEIARKLGVDVKDPEAVKAKIEELHAAVQRLANWPLYPDLVRAFREEEVKPALELKGETEAEIKAKEAAKTKAAEEERASAAAPPPEDFVMSGSTRPADEAAARGQQDMLGNTPLKPKETKGIFDAIVTGMRRSAGERRAADGKLDGVKEDRRVAAAMRRSEEASTKGTTNEKTAETKPSQTSKPEQTATLSIGKTPNSAEPLTVRDGKIFIGDDPAQNYETGEDVPIHEDATPQEIKDALMESGSIATGQKIFGMKPAKPHEAEVKPVSDTVKRIMAERERVAKKLQTTEGIELESLQEQPSSKLTPIEKDRLSELQLKEEVRATNALEDAADKAAKKEEFPSVNKIVNLNIGITPADLARGVGQIAEDAKAVLERAKATKMGAAASEWTEGIWHDIQMGASPMTTGSNRAMAIATDWASADRKSRWQMAQFDDVLRKQFDPTEQENMAVRMQEENDILRAKRKGLPVPEGGLEKLSPKERAVVDKLHNDAELIAQRARDKGMLGPKPVKPDDEGVDYWSPRQIVVYSETGEITTPKAGKGVSSPFTSPTGHNITTSAPSLLKRKHETLAETEAAAKAKFGEGAKVAMNIRSMPIAMGRIERAVAGRELIDGIKAIGEKTGQDLVVNSEQPGYFTVDHPSFKTFRPKTTTVDGKTTVVLDQNGKTVFDKVPLYVSKEFEGPLKAIMSDSPSNIAKTLAQLKGKTMGVIMYSPAIHNGVEFGRVLPAMPGKTITFIIYFDGAKARKDPAFMNRLIGQGNMVPINRSFAMQDITGIMEDPTIHPGRSWTSKVLAAPVGLVSKRGAEAVKRGVDKAGDIWHNTLLWDRIADLQAGIAYNVEIMEIKKGTDPLTATRIAGHEANRFAGALPYEAMSKSARNWANFMFFSRTFTMGNWGVAKDALKGLPRNVSAQIERDAGTVAMYAANSHAKKMAMKAIATDIVMMYAMNSALQSGFDKWKRDKSNDEISQGYADRFDRMIKRVQESPSELLHPFDQLASLTPMSENEPGKEYRVLYDYDEQGTAIYMRLPPGKMGEEYITYATSPLEMLKRKEGTIFRPLIQAATNDKGFGRKVYDDQSKGYKASAKAVGNIAWNILSQQIPMDSVNAAVDIARGESEQADAYKVIGPFFGLTFSKGAPGGAEVGELFTVERMHRAEVSEVMPDVKKLIKHGHTDEAVAKMSEAHFTPQEIRATIKFSMMPRARLSPQAMKKFIMTAPEEDKQKMQQMRDNAP